MTNLMHMIHMGGTEWKKGMGSWWKESNAGGDLGSQGGLRAAVKVSSVQSCAGQSAYSRPGESIILCLALGIFWILGTVWSPQEMHLQSEACLVWGLMETGEGKVAQSFLSKGRVNVGALFLLR